jgi:uncharacterized protein (DUF433 family)
MTDEQLLERITSNPKVIVGRPVIKGTRLMVHFILGRLAHGSTPEDLRREYPGLAIEDIPACLLFASTSLESVSSMPVGIPRMRCVSEVFEPGATRRDAGI